MSFSDSIEKYSCLSEHTISSIHISYLISSVFPLINLLFIRFTRRRTMESAWLRFLSIYYDIMYVTTPVVPKQRYNKGLLSLKDCTPRKHILSIESEVKVYKSLLFEEIINQNYYYLIEIMICLHINNLKRK